MARPPVEPGERVGREDEQDVALNHQTSVF
jgi:hypothetical protein